MRRLQKAQPDTSLPPLGMNGIQLDHTELQTPHPGQIVLPSGNKKAPADYAGADEENKLNDHRGIRIERIKSDHNYIIFY